MDSSPPKASHDWILVQEKNDAGLVALGGDFSQESLLWAYRKGWFPWYKAHDLIHWFSPEPRFIITAESFRIPKSLNPLLNSDKFRITQNQAFSEVMKICRETPRKGQESSWILPEMLPGYESLNKNGFADSTECWEGRELVAGLYGVRIGNGFSGESMFSKRDNASKLAFSRFADGFYKSGGMLIDCQIPSNLFSLFGGFETTRLEFEERWAEAID